MSLESILEHILKEAKQEAERIIRQAKGEAEHILEQAASEAEKLYQAQLKQEKMVYDREKQKAIVSARLEAKRNLLLAKQELINQVFERLKENISKAKLKKQEVRHDQVQEAYEDMNFYLNKIRPDYESKVAEILFA